MKKLIHFLLLSSIFFTNPLFAEDPFSKFKDYKTKGIKFNLEDREIKGYWYKVMGYNLDEDPFFEVLEFYEEIQEHPSYYFFDENDNNFYDSQELIIDDEIDGLNGNEMRNIKPYELKEPYSEVV